MGTPEYDFWLLDLDGTIVDTDPSYVHDVLKTVGRRLGVSFTDRETEALWYGFSGEREAVLAEAGVDTERFWSAFHEIEDPERRAAATHLYGDAAAFVPGIDRPTGLVTHCQQHLTEPVLDRLDIGDWFDTVVCCTDETGWKPDPGPVELAMQDLGVAGNGHEGVLVGDGPNDIGAARNADLDAIHVTRRNIAASPRWHGDFRIESFGELPATASGD